jgi:3-hydroxybutyryl-CoA dehydrogenase
MITMEIKKIAMVGLGTMGNQIAMQCAICGYEVHGYSRRQTTVDKAKAFSDDWFAKRVAKGKMTQEEADEIQGRLTFTADMTQACTGVDLVLEAVADVIDTKKKVLSQVDAITPDHCIYASNSSYIVASLFCDAVKHPENVCNLHFFNPALIMKCVEVVKGPHVNPEIIDIMVDFVKSIKKVPSVVNKEVYGFIVNRIFSAMTKEACYIYDQGIASVEDIDNAVKNALGHSMGPLEILDMTGIDLEYDVLMQKYRLTGDLADKPSPGLVEHYAKGEYGRKTGKGWYEYPAK